jgi:hypothetical protein
MVICYECGKRLVIDGIEIEPVHFRYDGECICAECDPKSAHPIRIDDNELPASTVAIFTTDGGDIRVDLHAGKLRIRAMDGAIDVRPNGSNEIYVSIGDYL